MNQNTALHYAVLLDDDEEICKLLLLSGADTQARNSAGSKRPTLPPSFFSFPTFPFIQNSMEVP